MQTGFWKRLVRPILADLLLTLLHCYMNIQTSLSTAELACANHLLLTNKNNEFTEIGLAEYLRNKVDKL